MSAIAAEVPSFCTINTSLTLTSSIGEPRTPAMIAGISFAGASQMMLLMITRLNVSTPVPAGARRRLTSGRNLCADPFSAVRTPSRRQLTDVVKTRFAIEVLSPEFYLQPPPKSAKRDTTAMKFVVCTKA